MATGIEPPETRYVSVEDASVAYQVVGDASPDFLYCYGLGSHVDLQWDYPGAAVVWERMAAFCRPIIFDRRGTGASDGVPRQAMPTWEEWAEDAGAVLDDVESSVAVLSADLDAGPFAILFAAMHPERVSALVLSNTFARFVKGNDYPIGIAPEAIQALVKLVSESWGTPKFAVLENPSLSIDDELARIGARTMRASATPRAAANQYEYILQNLDVRQALPLIQAPTLVLHTRGNRLVPVELGRYLADHIRDATFVEDPGSDLSATSTSENHYVDQVGEFLTGVRPTSPINRILTTMMFTDIVESTSQLVASGDERWRSVLDTHDALIRSQLGRFQGREVGTRGDGFFAAFDGPGRAIRCAQSITAATARVGLRVRVGLHTGECEVRGDDLDGLSVHIAARVGAIAGPGEVLVSATVKDLVLGSGIDFDDRGEHELKGVPGAWRLYAVTG